MLNNFNSFYKNKKVLVTGHTGFKGSWLTLWLTKLGAEVIGYALEPLTSPSLFEVLNLKDKITHIIGDIRDEEKLRKVFRTYKPDIVIHMAAQPLVRYSYLYPKYTYEVNIMGTINLLEIVKEVGSTKVTIIITSDKCYENKEWIYGYRETDSMGGYDPYSSSKGCVELIVSAYRRSYFEKMEIALSTVRVGNVIGGGDWQTDRLVPDCVRALFKEEPIIIRNPNSVRPWQYVLEPLSGYLLLGALMWKNSLEYSSAWNFGPNDKDILTVEEVVKKIIEYWGKGTYKVDMSEQVHEAKLLKLDISKAIFVLKWRPVYNVFEALEKTIDWYKKFYTLEGFDGYRYTIKQIREYSKK